MMTCPDCKTNVQSDMKYCPVCGSALALHAPVNSAIPSGIYLKWFDSFLKNSKMMSYAWEEKNASSPEFVGEIRFREFAKLVI